jgi:hypothetical protein
MPERPGFNPEEETEEQRARAERHAKADVDAFNESVGYPKYDQSPREKPFAETADESERQARYRVTAYNALDHVRAIIEEPDGLDDSMTRAHLHELRAALDRLDADQLDPDKARLQ